MTWNGDLLACITKLLSQNYEVSFRAARFDMVAIRLRRWTKDHKVHSEMTIDIYEDRIVEALTVMSEAIEENSEEPCLPWSSWQSQQKNEALQRENDNLRARNQDITTIIWEEITPHIKAIAASVEGRI